jgi:predicted RNase H-like nuclease (RuvC/YqgF family)
MADLEEEKKIESSKGKVLTAKESNVSKEEKIAKTQEKIKSTKSQEEMWRYEFENQFKQKPNLLSILRELRRTVYENNGIIDGIF